MWPAVVNVALFFWQNYQISYTWLNALVMGVASCQRECACQAPICPSRCSRGLTVVAAPLVLHASCAAPQRQHWQWQWHSPILHTPSTPLPVCFAFWLMDFRNQLSMSAWFVLRAGYLFLRTAKCHRLCGDSINQSPRIINNQRERAREREQHWALPWPDTSCPTRWRFWKIANQRNRKEFRTLQLTSTSIRAMCQKQRKFLDCCYCCSPPPLPSSSGILMNYTANCAVTIVRVRVHVRVSGKLFCCFPLRRHLIAPIVGSHDSI